ncbi:helix-turn-helix domain-containing protein [Neobacillus cucumis]|uniref:helix-turn-helix domain-containing protein n=1 Tax=Neobacillus cucumis TaxID=1740721 RepID=UPI00285352CB|nr:helix-turn-helix domain-containing protein [Neobacillus cucumis]MDR4946452.1 helix-turn-helix domain-containing protein [Neobacillus cucumis]
MSTLLDNQIYFPSQPEIKQNTLYYQELKPAGVWYSKDVALFYQFTTYADTATFLSLIPDGCFDFLFCCDPANPSAYLWTSPLYRKKQPEFRKDCQYFGVRFFPEQSIFKLNESMDLLLAQQIPLNEVLNEVEPMVELIISGKSFSERIQLFGEYLQEKQLKLEKDQKMVRYAIDQIYSSRGTVNVQDLSDSIGYSEQHIRRKFESYIGFSPKQFCQIVRFQNTLDMYLDRKGEDLLDIIYENGYYDQAHFIKGFKKFIHLTPKQYKKLFTNI